MEGIDGARQWPSMSDESRSLKPKRKVSGHPALGEFAQFYPKRRSDHLEHEMAAATSTPAFSFSMPRTTRVKDSITKDSTPRKWICRQVPVDTLGGEMLMPIWFSGTCLAEKLRHGYGMNSDYGFE